MRPATTTAHPLASTADTRSAISEPGAIASDNAANAGAKGG